MIHPRTMDSICKTIATMKKLFKNLMLVAVAAMAFVACSQEGNEVNILTKETTFEFTAGFNEDTRSGFGEKEGDAYPSVWNGGESIIAIFSNEDGFIGTASSSIDDLGEGIESSKTATFTVKYEGSLPDNYSVTFYSGNWYTNSETGEVYYYISDNQRCTDTSVESSNHLCKTEAIEVVNGEISTLNLTFNTATAFGKVTMEQFSDVADKISEVKVTINGDTTYTVTPETLTKPVVWFACEAIESVTSLIVEAKVDGVTYIKTKEDIAEGALSFNTGRIRPINVKDMTEKPADYNVVLTKVTNIEGNTISFVGEDSNDKLTLAINPGLETIVAGTYTGVDATYGPGFSSDSALEYDFNGSYFNVSAAYNEAYDYYLNGSPIVITDLGDNNFRIVYNASFYYPAASATKTVKITYEGKLEAELPAFTSAKITNTSMGDKLVQFTSNELGTLQLNFYNCNYNNWIDARTYTFANSGEIYPGGSYSWYKDIDGTTYYAVAGTVVVTIVNGKYHIEFSNITDYNGSYTLNAVYEGDIEGLIVPDLREPLATPSNLDYTIEGNIVTITWDAVENAGSYLVYTDSVEVTTNDTFATFELEVYGYYNFYVKALASEANSDTYRDSSDGSINVAYEDPRPMLELSNVSATASGNTVTISWDAVEDAGSYTVTFNGNTQDTNDTKVVFTELEYNKDYYYSVVAKPANEETHRASYAYSNSVTTERDPNAGFDYDITFTSCSVGSNNMYTFTDGSYTLKLKLNSALAVGTFENVQWNNEYWDGNETTLDVPNVSYSSYIYNGKLEVSLDGDIYTIVLTSFDCWVNGIESTIKLTYVGSIGGGSSSGPDTTGYTLLATGSHSWGGSTLIISDTNYELQARLYNGGAGSTVVVGDYTFGGTMSIEGTISGINLVDGSKATIYDNGNDTYTVLLDLAYIVSGSTQTYKLYYTFSE